MDLYYLSFFASRAAISIEFIKSNAEAKFDRLRVNKLADGLDFLSKQEDFTTRMMLSRLFWPNQRTVEQVMSGEANVHANLFAKDLRNIYDFNSGDQSEIIEYCIRLSNLAMKYSIM